VTCMRDSDPPICPACRLRFPLRKLRELVTPGRTREDADYLAGILYRCPGCKRTWKDGMDGEALQREESTGRAKRR